jgi:hypothetical protein
MIPCDHRWLTRRRCGRESPGAGAADPLAAPTCEAEMDQDNVNCAIVHNVARVDPAVDKP